MQAIEESVLYHHHYSHYLGERCHPSCKLYSAASSRRGAAIVLFLCIHSLDSFRHCSFQVTRHGDRWQLTAMQLSILFQKELFIQMMRRVLHAYSTFHVAWLLEYVATSQV